MCAAINSGEWQYYVLLVQESISLEIYLLHFLIVVIVEAVLQIYCIAPVYHLTYMDHCKLCSQLCQLLLNGNGSLEYFMKFFKL